MSRVAPAARARSVAEAISRLQRLQRKMDQLCKRDRSYASQRRALHEAIRHLRSSAQPKKVR
jgi:hypothetical protein